MKKAFVENENLMFNSNSKGLINLGNVYQVALWGVSDCPSGWSEEEILREAGMDEAFFESARTIKSADYMFVNEWLPETLYNAWTSGKSVSMSSNQTDEEKIEYRSRYDEASWLPQSQNTIEVITWYATKVTQFFIDGSPIVTITQKGVGSRRVELPLLTKQVSNVCPSIQVSIDAPGEYQF